MGEERVELLIGQTRRHVCDSLHEKKEKKKKREEEKIAVCQDEKGTYEFCNTSGIKTTVGGMLCSEK